MGNSQARRNRAHATGLASGGDLAGRTTRNATTLFAGEAFQYFFPPVGRTTIPGPETERIEKTVDGMYLLLLRIESVTDGLNQSNLQAVNAGQGTVDSGGVAGFALPVLRYYVGTGGGSQIDEFNAVDHQLAPADMAEFGADQPILFTWPSVPRTKYYRLVIQSAAGVEVFSAVTLSDTSTYTAPSWLLTRAAGDLLRWQVLAFDAKGTKLSETNLRTLRRISE